MGDEENKAEYLGDALYVRVLNGYMLALYANDPHAPSDVVYLEPEVFKELVRYARRAGLEVPND